MNSRKWLAGLALGIGLILSGNYSAAAAERKTVPTHFGALRTASVEEARNQAAEWLRSIGKMNDSEFYKVWSKESLSVLDRTIRSLAMGHPEVDQLLQAARDPEQPAPKTVPPIFLDEKLSPFFRSNLAVAYAKALTTRRDYEVALDTLKTTRPEAVVDPASYLFHKAVAEHAMMLKDDANKTIVRLLDDVVDAPDRYKILATLMYFDMRSWKKEERDLNNIARMMENIERRLGLARGGEKTQELQKKVIFRLDELIKEKENQQKQGGGGGQGKNGGNCPEGGQAQKPGGGQGPNPMQDSNIATNGGKGEVTEKKIQEYAANWGNMPEHKRKEALQEMTRDLPPRYREVIEAYFKSLSEGKPSR